MKSYLSVFIVSALLISGCSSQSESEISMNTSSLLPLVFMDEQVWIQCTKDLGYRREQMEAADLILRFSVRNPNSTAFDTSNLQTFEPQFTLLNVNGLGRLTNYSPSYLIDNKSNLPNTEVLKPGAEGEIFLLWGMLFTGTKFNKIEVKINNEIVLLQEADIRYEMCV